MLDIRDSYWSLHLYYRRRLACCCLGEFNNADLLFFVEEIFSCMPSRCSRDNEALFRVDDTFYLTFQRNAIKPSTTETHFCHQQKSVIVVTLPLPHLLRALCYYDIYGCDAIMWLNIWDMDRGTSSSKFSRNTRKSRRNGTGIVVCVSYILDCIYVVRTITRLQRGNLREKKSI